MNIVDIIRTWDVIPSSPINIVLLDKEEYYWRLASEPESSNIKIGTKQINYNSDNLIESIAWANT
jgi:hypothetical protein